jgi:hypothetical protein
LEALTQVISDSLGRNTAMNMEALTPVLKAVCANPNNRCSPDDLRTAVSLLGVFSDLGQAISEFNHASSKDKESAGRQLILQSLTTTQEIVQKLSSPVPAEFTHGILIVKNVVAGDFSGALVALTGEESLFKTLGSGGDYLQKLMGVAPVVAAIAESKSSADVEAALEGAAAPLGSWRIRKQKVVYGLNAKLGGTAGGEWLDNFAGNKGSELGIYAPVSAGVSFPLHNGWIPSIGVDVQILDVGSLMNVNLSGASVKSLPNVTWSTVLAPGGIVYAGLADTPFVFGVDASWSPQARTYTDPNTEVTSTLNAVRVGGFIAIDIPVFMF